MTELLAEKTGFRVVGNYGYIDYLKAHAVKLGEAEGKKRPLWRDSFHYCVYLCDNDVYVHQAIKDDGRLWYYGDANKLLKFIFETETTASYCVKKLIETVFEFSEE